MKNKTKLFLVSVMTLGLSFLLTGKAQAGDCSCGTATSVSHSTAPTSGLCASGSPSVVASTDGYWNWTCGDGSCNEVSCSARSATSITLGCCCEDTVTKQCTNVACPASCGASSTSHSTVCSAIPNSATACGGVSSGGSTTCSTVCVPSASCTKTKTGSCSTAGYVCCESSGSSSGSTTTGSGITFPTNTGLPTNSNLVKGIFTNVANWLLSIIGIIAIISFVISGIQYFLVATDEKMMETAKKTMVASIIGLVVALFGYIAVKTVEMLLNG